MPEPDASDLDASLTPLWDWSDPAGSEARFRARAAHATPTVRLVALTQVARALGLQERYAEAEALLHEVAGAAGDDFPEVAVRVALERGRLARSSGRADQAAPLFQEAAELAEQAACEALHVDALHMLALDGGPDQQIARTRAALTVARSASSEEARRWDASLLNNLGMALHDAGDLPAALESFEEAQALRAARGQEREEQIARWMVAWTLRLLDRKEEALSIQRRLKTELLQAGVEDTYVDQELALLEAGGPEEEVP